MTVEKSNSTILNATIKQFAISYNCTYSGMVKVIWPVFKPPVKPPVKPDQICSTNLPEKSKTKYLHSTEYQQVTGFR